MLKKKAAIVVANRNGVSLRALVVRLGAADLKNGREYKFDLNIVNI